MGSKRKKKRVYERFESPLTLMWYKHFKSISPEMATCSDCSDFKQGGCFGGKDPVECMIEENKDCIFVI